MTEETTRYLDVVYGKDMLPEVYDCRMELIKNIGRLKGAKHLSAIKFSTILQYAYEANGKCINYIDIDKVEIDDSTFYEGLDVYNSHYERAINE